MKNIRTRGQQVAFGRARTTPLLLPRPHPRGSSPPVPGLSLQQKTFRLPLSSAHFSCGSHRPFPPNHLLSPQLLLFPSPRSQRVLHANSCTTSPREADRLSVDFLAPFFCFSRSKWPVLSQALQQTFCSDYSLLHPRIPRRINKCIYKYLQTPSLSSFINVSS